MKKAQPRIISAEPSDNSNFNIHYKAIKAKLLASDNVRLIYFQESDRHEVIGAIAMLRDQLPIVSTWRTLRQSYVNETRTRCLCYYIPQTFLRGVTP